MTSEEAREFKAQLERLFGALGEEVPRTTPRQPRRPQDAVCVAYRFYTPARQVFEVSFNTQKNTVAAVINPPVGKMIHVRNASHIGPVIVELRALLELENGVLKNPAAIMKPEKVLA